MSQSFEPYTRAMRHVGPILFRHVFVLVNAIIFLVAILLYVFSDIQAAVFLAFILCINTLIGVVQDFQAMVSLERLQLLTASRILRTDRDGKQESVLAEKLEQGDSIRVNRGDQIPCDGTVVDSCNLEVSDALITGESDTFPKIKGNEVLAGGIVTSGWADILVRSAYRDSRISRMSDNLKEYRATPSPIQRSVGKIIFYSSIVLVATILFVVFHGTIVGDAAIVMVRQVGALASTIVPQGLIVITTLLFAFGASSYSRRHVLFQEINAAEKLGRIINLCMDKTGTLTDNKLLVENVVVGETWIPEEVKKLTAAYIHGSGDSSQTIYAISDYVGTWDKHDEILEVLPFSSWRQYGAVHVKHMQKDIRVLVGPIDLFLPHVSQSKEKDQLVQNVAALGVGKEKRMLCVAEVNANTLPQSLSGSNLSILAVYVLGSGLREGIQDAIEFFQKRGVAIRILSGDNPETVSAVAQMAGVHDADKVIIGADMLSWGDNDYRKNVTSYRIFARVLPEQKVKIIEALKEDGFTAMVGDGANDALAIRKADLGIAMFDGAQATRQLAAVVLMNNSFTALPGAVKLADSFIQHLEIFASIFLNQSMLGLFFFIFISTFGYEFPFTPLNITPINYFAVGLPAILIGYWALRRGENAPPAKTGEFMRRVLVFPAVVALVEAVGVGVMYVYSVDQMGNAASSTLFGGAFIILGLTFFIFAPTVYQKIMTKREWTELSLLYIFEIVLFSLAYQSTFLKKLFEIQPLPTQEQTILAIGIIVFVVLAQYYIARWFFKRKVPVQISR